MGNKILKHFYYMLLLVFLGACSTGIQESRHPVYFENSNKGPTIERFDEYHLRGGDILDIIYQVRPQKIGEYRLNIQDVIKVRFPSMPEHDIQQVIRPDGMITLPYIGDINVLNLTPEAATKKIRLFYKEILRLPDIYLIVKEFGAGTKELKRVITTASRGQSKLLTVRPDGVVTFPLIGDMLVVEKTIPEISSVVNKQYKELYPELQVDVILYKAVGSYVYVLGEVRRPGAYTINRPVTIYQALSMGGGLTPVARLDDVVMMRRKGATMECRIVDVKSVLTAGKESVYVLLKPDDIIYVPKRRLATAAQIAKEISDLIFFRGYSLGFSWEVYTVNN